MRQKNNRRVRKIVPGSLVKAGSTPMYGSFIDKVHSDDFPHVVRDAHVYGDFGDIGFVTGVIGRTVVVLWSRRPRTTAPDMMLHAAEHLIGIARPC